MSTKLFVGNLSPKTTGEQLTRFFSSAGLVASVRMPLDRQTGRARGFAFVEFSSKEQAEQALKVFDGRELGGNRLRVSMARPEGGSSPERSREFGGREARRGQQVGDSLDLTAPEDWRPPRDDDPYAEDRGRRRHRHGKHGSDRRRRHGARRYVD
jgi:RNA recognition motif-containing protein